jgi:hypothetical protein
MARFLLMRRFAAIHALALLGCGPTGMAPPPPCPVEPCSNGTPRFGNNPPAGDASVPTDAGRSDASTDASSDAGPLTAVRGIVGQVNTMPRTRPTHTTAAVGWVVQSLLDPSRSTMSSMTGAFALDVPRDRDGVGPLRAESVAPPRQCAIGHARADSADVSVVALDPLRLGELVAPSGFTVDPARAQLVVEVEDSLRARVRNVSITLRPASIEGIAYDLEGDRFALGMATGTQGTALITNIEFMGTTAKVDLVLTRDGRTRTLPIYFARGCTTFVTALAP